MVAQDRLRSETARLALPESRPSRQPLEKRRLLGFACLPCCKRLAPPSRISPEGGVVGTAPADLGLRHCFASLNQCGTL